jgi:hypothetical protein
MIIIIIIIYYDYDYYYYYYFYYYYYCDINKLIVLCARVPRLHNTGISWPNWTETQKMRSWNILKLMPRVDGNTMGPEARM